ncbi:protein AATF-like [Ixodes scapularis]
MSLIKELSDLVNTAPALADPEDDVHEDTKAKVVESYGNDYEEVPVQKKLLRRQPLPLTDEKYAGKRVSRKDLDKESSGSDDDCLSDGVDEEDVVEITDNDESDAVEVISDDDGSGGVDTKAGDEHDESEESANDGDSGKADEEGDEDTASDDNEDESQMDANDDVQLGTADNQSLDDDMVQKFSTVDVSGEVQKGKAVRSQLLVWDSIVELRIQLQKLLVLANRFPRHCRYPYFKSAALQGDKKNANLLRLATKSVEDLLQQLLGLQQDLKGAHPEVASVFGLAHEKQEDAMSEDCRLIIFGTRAAVGKLANQGPAVPVRPVTSPQGPRDLAQFAQQGSVADFELSRSTGTPRRTSTAKSPRAPFKSDVWAVGILLWDIRHFGLDAPPRPVRSGDDYLSDGVDEEDVVEITDNDESDAVEVISDDEDKSSGVNTKSGDEHDESEESADDGDSGKADEEGDEDAASDDDEDESQMDANDDVQLGTADNQSLDDDMVQKFSTVDVSGEVQKGKAVRSQLLVWDSIVELRIQLQKLLVLANRFPRHCRYPYFKSAALQGDKKNANLLRLATKSVEDLLQQLLGLQQDLKGAHPEVASVFGLAHEKQEDAMSDDEEIPSDTDDEGSDGGPGGEDEDDAEEEEEGQAPEKPAKKRRMDDCIADIEAFYKTFEPFRNSTIDKWYERTRLSSGRINKGFQALEQSPLKQIEHILTDEERLLRRTQTKRSSYRVLGDPESSQQNEATTIGSREIDEEIFDDDDFYHHLLREIIERKSSNVENPVALSRQWLEIQKLRNKVKRKVDTKASKGRKIRYDVIPKLVNYMAPVDLSTYSEEAKTELFGSLFGQKKYAR